MTDNIEPATAAADRAEAKAQAVEDQAITVERLDRLITASERQTAASEKLALATVEHQERARLARRRYLVTIVVIVLGFTGLYIRQEIGNRSSQRARDTILSCITPQGECFKDNQKRTAGVIGNVQKIIVLAAACAPSYIALPVPERTVAIEHCIEKGLAK